MKSNLGRKARLLALLALVAVLPLSIGACGDGGDSEGGPTGPSTQYNPEIDYPGATITAVANKSSVTPGGEFDIVATFKDANGLPVQGVPLYVLAESGGAGGDFSYKTNPTMTDGSGKASIGVVVSAGCPNGSYQFTIYSVRAAQARGYVGVEVNGSAGTPIITSVTLTTSTSSVNLASSSAANFTASATSTAGCTVRFKVQAAGAGMSLTWRDASSGAGNPWLFSLPSVDFPGTLNAGTLTVIVAAYCNETGDGMYSSPINVTVTGP